MKTDREKSIRKVRMTKSYFRKVQKWIIIKIDQENELKFIRNLNTQEKKVTPQKLEATMNIFWIFFLR